MHLSDIYSETCLQRTTNYRGRVSLHDMCPFIASIWTSGGYYISWSEGVPSSAFLLRTGFSVYCKSIFTGEDTCLFKALSCWWYWQILRFAHQLLWCLHASITGDMQVCIFKMIKLIMDIFRLSITVNTYMVYSIKGYMPWYICCHHTKKIWLDNITWQDKISQLHTYKQYTTMIREK